MIKELYKNTMINVRVNENESENFDTMKGVRQGCLLSPGLFAAYMGDLEEMFSKLQVMTGRNKVWVWLWLKPSKDKRSKK